MAINNITTQLDVLGGASKTENKADSHGIFKGVVSDLRAQGQTYEKSVESGAAVAGGDDFITALAELETNFTIANRLLQETLAMVKEMAHIQT